MVGRVTQVSQGGWTVIAVSGDADLVLVPDLRAALRSSAASPSPRVVVDLTEADLVDSSAIGILIGARRRIADRGGRLQLVLPDGAPRRSLTAAEVVDLFDVVRTISAAVEN